MTRSLRELCKSVAISFGDADTIDQDLPDFDDVCTCGKYAECDFCGEEHVLIEKCPLCAMTGIDHRKKA